MLFKPHTVGNFAQIWILKRVIWTVYCDTFQVQDVQENLHSHVLITNEMHNSYNQFLFHSFLSALHVSNESSRSSSGTRHNILYYTVWYNRYTRAIRRVQFLAARLAFTIDTKLCNTAYYAVLLLMNDQIVRNMQSRQKKTVE